MSDVTQLLAQIESGDRRAAADLLPLVYEELRKLAAARMSRERSDHTLSATALVHEAYLRLVGGAPKESHWSGNSHFFAAAAEAMRRILVERARKRGRLKRGGDLQRLELDAVQLSVEEVPDDLLALDDALNQLAETHPEKAELVKLRYFAGLTADEAAKVLGIAPSTADRHWSYARVWLYRRIVGDAEL
jgi:RNA polymerase sigma factor (TIGR02999 family)